MRRVGCVLAAVAFALGSVAPGAVMSARQRQLASIPQSVLWAWERPEDLRAIGRDTAIAFLAQTITIGDRPPTVVARTRSARLRA